MHTVVIIHGSYGSPDENWFPWLKRKLEAKGHGVIVPKLPTPEGQNLQSWRRAFDAQTGKLTPDHLLVGHSLGVAFAFDVLQRSEARVMGSFFAGGFLGPVGSPKFDTINSTFVSRDFDWPAIRARMGSAFMYHGDDDPYVPASKCLDIAGHLQLTPRIIESGGHLNAAAGYAAFEGLYSDLAGVLDAGT